MLLSVTATCLSPFPAFALQPEAGDATPGRSIETPADRFGFGQGEQIQFSVGTEEQTVTFRAELPTGPATPWRFSLIGSAPLDNDDDAMPESLDALANGTRLTLRAGHFWLGAAAPNDRAIEIAAVARVACEEAGVSGGEARADARARCEGMEPNALVRTHALPRYRDFLRNTMPKGGLDAGIDLTLGINEFQWIDPVTFGPQREQEVDWSISGNVAWYPVPGFVLTGSASYQSAYEAATEQQICPPNAACVTARGAAPTRKEHFVISGGFRYRFAGQDGRLLRLAVAPQVTYDVEDDVWGVDVPLYFIPGPEGGLNGGIRLGYRSDRDNEFSATIFVGTAFNLLQ